MLFQGWLSGGRKMLLFAWTSVIICSEVIGRSLQNDYFNDQDYRYCAHVPYWQCKEDFSGLLDEETDNMSDFIDGVDVRTDNEYQSGLAEADLNVCCLIECGKRMTVSSEVLVNRNSVHEQFGSRILGGMKAEFAEFPWVLGILEDKTHKYRCGASLIHPQVALTAAHCVSGNIPLIVRAGEWNWESNKESLPHQNRNVKSIIKHPYFHAASLRNDIALVIVETPFHLMRNVGLICLPQQGTTFDEANCVAAGWGKNSYKKGTYQSTLKKVHLPIVPHLQCLKSLQDAALGPYYMLHPSFICAGGGANKDTCKGDGGSPLMCPIKGHRGKYQQVGIVSWGLTCGRYTTPGVYVNLSMFRSWIDYLMSLHGFETAVNKFEKR